MSKSLGLIDVVFLVLLALASMILREPADPAPERAGAQQHLEARKLATAMPRESFAQTMSL